MTSAYDFVVKDSKGNDYPLAQHRGRVTMVMNVASQCGYTQNGYEVATALFDKYRDQGFSVLAFPCNQFGGQEPGPVDQVEHLVCTRFKGNFPIMAKVDVNGKDAPPFWDHIKHAQPGILGTTGIKWNFTVFLIDKAGRCVDRLSPGAKLSEVEPKVVALMQAPA